MTLGHFIYFGFYIAAIVILSLFGLHKYLLLYARHKYRHDPVKPARAISDWPKVTIQLPVFNEKYVVKRLLRAAVKLDYPANKLHIQVLDDSMDETKRIVSRLVGSCGAKASTLNIFIARIALIQSRCAGKRPVPNGCALHRHPGCGLCAECGFLKTVPYLAKIIVLGWCKHAGAHQSQLLIAYQIASDLPDAHFLIEHYARNRSGKFFNFNGTAGIWRKQAIIDAGGWQHDTLTEDLI